ncbi:MAG: ribonuclease HI [Xanthomonadales bacterium]|nr:ribonuclease HI [Xanthomonadales bacterium]MBK7146813.1 ribonuclease HI [Xanthomonadales bacterium]MCC6561535.1 ribonuclease HI [Xanthomonadales bacterium]
MSGERVAIYTDGACSGNPGPGGWAALLRYRGQERWLNGAEPQTTNNRMELTAALRALESLKKSCAVDLTTDSQYLKQGVEQWMAGWKRNGWRTSGRDPVKNRDLWEAIDRVLGLHEVRFHWVRGHDGHAENEAVDAHARAAIRDLLGQEPR